MFGTRINLFRLAGFPIRLDLSWFIILLLLTWSLAVGVFPTTAPGLSTGAYWTMGLVGALGLFASVLLHELAHAVVARRNGLPIRGITLFIFGGVAELESEPPNARTEFLVAIAGPIASVVIAGVLLGTTWVGAGLGWSAAVNSVLGYLWIINLIVVGFNLVPAFPLDGGRVLRAGLWHWSDNLRWATRITTAIGGGFGIALIVLGVINIVMGAFVAGMWWVLIGLFLRSAANMSYQQVLIRRALEGEKVERFITRDPVTVPPTITVRDLVENYVYRHHFNLFPVTTNGHLQGCVSTHEIREIPRAEWDHRTVADIVQSCSTENVVPPGEDAMRALSKMNQRNGGPLMVVDGERLVGIVTLKDLLRFIALRVELDEPRAAALPAR